MDETVIEAEDHEEMEMEGDQIVVMLRTQLIKKYNYCYNYIFLE